MGRLLGKLFELDFMLLAFGRTWSAEEPVKSEEGTVTPVCERGNPGLAAYDSQSQRTTAKIRAYDPDSESTTGDLSIVIR